MSGQELDIKMTLEPPCDNTALTGSRQQDAVDTGVGAGSLGTRLSPGLTPL